MFLLKKYDIMYSEISRKGFSNKVLIMNDNQDYTPGQDSFFYESSMPEGNLDQNENNGKSKSYANAALWLGIAGVLVCFCCCCAYYLALPLGIIGIVMACLARRDANGTMPTKAKVGLILCILAIVLFVVFLGVEIIMVTSITEAEIREIIDQAFMEEFGVDFETWYKSFLSEASTETIE